MRNRTVNLYIGALIITIVGSLATLMIVHVAVTTTSFNYTPQYFAPERGDAGT